MDLRLIHHFHLRGRCALEPVIEAAKMIQRHWQGILQFVESRITTGFVEGVNYPQNVEENLKDKQGGSVSIKLVDTTPVLRVFEWRLV